MYKKIIKWLLIICVTVTVIINIWAMVTTYTHQGYPNSRNTQLFLPRVINSALGIPYYNESAVINDSSEKVNFSMKEWMELKCSPNVYIDSVVLRGVNTFKGPTTPKEMSEEDEIHLNCLGLNHVWEYEEKSSKDVQGELCNNVFTCQTINLAVTDYILAYPQVLWNMLKIIERPCDYIKKKGEGVDKNEERSIDYLRAVIKCDGANTLWFKKNRIFVILTVWNSKNKEIAHFIVRRKDMN